MAKLDFPRQGEVWWVNLDPAVGQEISKKRPCLVLSPDDMNAHLVTVMVAPITSTRKAWPTRVAVQLPQHNSAIALDQLRAIDQTRLINLMTTVDAEPALAVLRDMFAKI